MYCCLCTLMQTVSLLVSCEKRKKIIVKPIRMFVFAILFGCPGWNIFFLWKNLPCKQNQSMIFSNYLWIDMIFVKLKYWRIGIIFVKLKCGEYIRNLFVTWKSANRFVTNLFANYKRIYKYSLNTALVWL